jgi:hypothetical protein
MADKTRRVEVCTCENCGNEADMVVTCKLVSVGPGGAVARPTECERHTLTGVGRGSEAERFVAL